MTVSRQLELFAGPARTVAVLGIPRSEFRPQPTEADVQAKLDAARQRLHEIVILRLNEDLDARGDAEGMRQAETFRREQVRMHFCLLEHVTRSAVFATGVAIPPVDEPRHVPQ
jgi:hypothetical protein